MNGLGYFKTNRIKQKYQVKNSKMLVFIVILTCKNKMAANQSIEMYF